MDDLRKYLIVPEVAKKRREKIEGLEGKGKDGGN